MYKNNNLFMRMVLTRKKGADLLFALRKFYKTNDIKLSKNKSMSSIELCADIIHRYTYVLLVENKKKYLCNNPKYLKKWIMFESLRNLEPLK